MSILIFLLIPMVMTGLIGMIFGPSSSSTQFPAIKILMVDKDKNVASKMFQGMFDSKEMKDMFELTMVSEQEGQKLMSKGKASALIIIPEKFTENLMDGKNISLTLIKNPSQEFLPSIVEEFLNTLSTGISGISQVFKEEMTNLKKLIDTSELENVSFIALAPYMEKTKDKIVVLKKYLSPVLIDLKKEVTEKPGAKQEAGFNIFAFILPGMAIMFLLFIVEAFMRDILTERENGIIRRMMFSPIRSMDVVIGRIIGGWIMGIVVYTIIIVLGTLIFNITWGNYVHLFILVAITCFWCASFFALLNSFFKNKNQAGAFTSPIILVFAAFGGSMMPLNQIPAAMKWLSNFTVNRWFIEGSQKITDGIFPVMSIIVLLGTGLLLFTAAIFSLNRKITV